MEKIKTPTATYLKDLSLNDIKKKLADLHPELSYPQLVSSIKGYKIEYETNYRQEKIKVSGVIYLPENISGKIPIISYQHETIFCKANAPSVGANNLLPEIICAHGFIVFVADYIGYGSSDKYFHPYYDKNHAASTVIDLIKAGLILLKDLKIKFDNQLSLIGYSEGGYVTIAALQALEKDPIAGIKLNAVAACAGGYDLFDMLSNFTSGTGTPTDPAYVIFLLLAYEKVNGWEKGIDYYFSKKYAAKMEDLFCGLYDNEEIKKQLTYDLKELFNPEFYLNLAGNGALELKKALYYNSLSNWAPTTPLRLYHGDADDVIPIRNSQVTFESYLKNGSKDVEFITLHGETHSSSARRMLLTALPWIKGKI